MIYKRVSGECERGTQKCVRAPRGVLITFGGTAYRAASVSDRSSLYFNSIPFTIGSSWFKDTPSKIQSSSTS
jgi:hypothetical protein